MRLLIFSALFLIFSTACASPVYIAPRNSETSWGLFAKLSEDQFQAIYQQEGTKSIACATSDRLVQVSHEAAEYQILALGGSNRNFDTEMARFKQRKILLGFKRTKKNDFFIFPPKTFSSSPKIHDPLSKEYEQVIKAAEEAYGTQRDPKIKPNLFNFIYDEPNNPTIAVYMPGLADNWGLLTQISDEEFLQMYQQQGHKWVARGTFDLLVLVSYAGVNYQILDSRGSRDFGKEMARFGQREILLGFKRIKQRGSQKRGFFIFPAETFSSITPKKCDPPKVYGQVMKDAEEAYGKKWDPEIKPEAKFSQDFIYDNPNKPTIAVYLPELGIRFQGPLLRPLRPGSSWPTR